MLPDYLDFAYLRSVFRRRFWAFTIVWTVMSIIGIMVAFVLPPIFKSSATILVESPQIPEELVKSTVRVSAIEQIQVVQQKLMTRSTLLELAEKHELYKEREDLSPSERVQDMRERARFSLIDFNQRRFGRNVSTATAFSVSFTSEKAASAAAVANEIVTLILDQNAELRRNTAESTSEFFRQEVERLDKALNELEQAIVDFQKSNEQSLPDSLAYRRSQFDISQERIARLESQRLELQQEKSVLELVLTQTQTADPITGRGQTPTERELAALNRKLVQRLTILSENHPEIKSLRKQISALELAVTVEPEEGGEVAPLSANDAKRLETEQRLKLVDARIEFVDAQIRQFAEERDRLERAILETPVVEMEITQLRRSYEDLQAQYNAAQKKLTAAETGEKLEDRQQGQRFSVIEQPVVPDRPESPNRVRIGAVGVAGGFSIGLAMIIFLELISTIVRRPADLARIDIEPIAVVPYIETAGERRRRWIGRLTVLTVIFGGGAIALYLVHTYYLPLETIAEKLMKKAHLDDAIELFRQRFGI